MVNTPKIFKDLYESLSTWKECDICGYMCSPDKVNTQSIESENYGYHDYKICDDCDS